MVGQPGVVVVGAVVVGAVVGGAVVVGAVVVGAVVVGAVVIGAVVRLELHAGQRRAGDCKQDSGGDPDP